MIKKDGSILLVILVMTSCLGILVLTLWRRASLGYEVELLREEFLYNTSVANAVFVFATQVVKNNFDVFMEKLCGYDAPSVKFSCSSLAQTLVKDKHITAQCNVCATELVASVRVQTVLLNGDRVLGQIQGIVTRTARYDSVTKKNKYHFFIDYYTLGGCV